MRSDSIFSSYRNACSLIHSCSQVAVLINNAGVAALDGKRGTSWENRDVWTEVLNTNVVGYMFLSPSICCAI